MRAVDLIKHLAELLSVLEPAFLGLVGDDLPGLRAEAYEVQLCFDVGLVEAGEALVGVEGFELGVEVLFGVGGVLVLVEALAVVVVGGGESNLD